MRSFSLVAASGDLVGASSYGVEQAPRYKHMIRGSSASSFVVAPRTSRVGIAV